MSEFSLRSIPGLDSIPGMDVLQREIKRTTEGVKSDLKAGAAYAPADATLWDDPAPTTIVEAIDRLAAFVKNEHGGSDL